MRFLAKLVNTGLNKMISKRDILERFINVMGYTKVYVSMNEITSNYEDFIRDKMANIYITSDHMFLNIYRGQELICITEEFLDKNTLWSYIFMLRSLYLKFNDLDWSTILKAYGWGDKSIIDVILISNKRELLMLIDCILHMKEK